MEVVMLVLELMTATFAVYLIRTRSWLGALNFAVLQWLGVRLQAGWEPTECPAGRAGRWWSPSAPPRGARVHWSLLRWVVPLTGWWSPYRWIARR